jgi:hypothetical protein
MDYYLLQEQWASLVRQFKDSERALDHDAYEAEQVALFVLDYIRYTRMRSYNLFTQKRGEDFERMLDIAARKEYSVDAIHRFVEDDDRWKTTLELAEQ